MSTPSPDSDSAIAIVAMSGRFPGARDVDELWSNLVRGVESIAFYSQEELARYGVDRELLENPDYVRADALPADYDLFDAAFFDIRPGEAEIMDPQHRLLLECAWETLETAGYDGAACEEAIGVYAGVGMNTYLLEGLAREPGRLRAAPALDVQVGSDKDFAPARVSYKLNLIGPSISVQTACSTSLVAVHLAVQSLLNGECRMALAGGASLHVPGARHGYLYEEGMIRSPDGHCRAFDARAQGTVFGSGVGLVALKRLCDAQADGDCIHGVIRGSAVNNDGSIKVGFTAPDVDGQAAVIAEAMDLAEIDASMVHYVEAHGTGTPLGDLIEIKALTKAFRETTQKTGYCAVGSVKTNIGHLDAAAGIAGLIKAVMAVKHGLIPPSLHFEQPSPDLELAGSPFFVNTKLSPWPASETPRRAGVSSFGIGGTNAHVVVEQAPAAPQPGPSRPWQLLVVSAKTPAALEAATDRLADRLGDGPEELELADVAYTLSRGRRSFHERRIVVSHECGEASSLLGRRSRRRVFTAPAPPEGKPVVFMLSGQGSQYVDAAAEVYECEPVFREQVDFCLDYLEEHAGCGLRTVLYPGSGDREQAARNLDQTQYAQPAVFVVSYALARQWMAWGIRPQAMIGHSIGEYVAACLADVISVEDALRLTVIRGRMMQHLPGGAMLSVWLDEEQVLALLGEGLSVAATNAPSLCTVSANDEAVASLESRLGEMGVKCRRLSTSHAFHSEMMEPILAPFTAEVRRVGLRAPRIPVVSNVTGTWLTASEAVSPDYWALHLRRTVRFGEGLRHLQEELDPIFLEVGPGRTLSQLVPPSEGRTVLSTLPHRQDRNSEEAHLLTTLGRLWTVGAMPDWAAFYAHERRRRLPLPTYPFERRRYWLGSPASASAVRGAARQRTAVEAADVSDCFHLPSWRRCEELSDGGEVARSSWLLFVDDRGVGSGLADRLRDHGHEVVAVRAGAAFVRHSGRDYTIDPRRAEDYKRLLRSLTVEASMPEDVVHLWSVQAPAEGSVFDRLERAQDLGFHSLSYLAQALGEGLHDPRQVAVVSNNVQEVVGGDALCPEKATVLGWCRVFPQEYPNTSCRAIDLDLAGPSARSVLDDQLYPALTTPSDEDVVACRGAYRWARRFEAGRNESFSRREPPLRQGGVYLITGGLGKVGLALARYLATQVQASLVLVGRTGLPPRDTWSDEADRTDELARRIEGVQHLESLASSVSVAAADVTDVEAMRNVVREAEQQHGPIHGVIHAAGLRQAELFCPIRDLERSRSEEVFRAKIIGTMVLDQVLESRSLDFCVAMSSLSSLLGGLGAAAYSAANAFLDAHAHRSHRGGPRPWMAVNWDRWDFEGPARPPGHVADETAMSPRQGVDAFARLLSVRGCPQVAISMRGLGSGDGRQPASSREPSGSDAGTAPLHPRPALPQDYVAPRNEVEKCVAAVWQTLLGIDRVGVHDNFFDLGGNSVLIVQASGSLRKALRQDVSPTDMLEFPTIHAFAGHLAAARRTGTDRGAQ